ncbi:MAG: KH domain-containing protein [Leptospirales bacterium]|nr:KH domain-containing protein [Leptospirales bacterium]
MSYYLLEIEGKARGDAEAYALDQLQASREQVSFESAGQTTGLMRLVKRDQGVLRVLPVDATPFEVHVRGALLSIVARLGVDAWIIRTGERDENFYVELGSEESGFLIGKHGRTLDAIQFLVNLIVNTRTRKGQRVMVDVESYRERRQKSITKLAERMAERVARSGRAVLLNYMNPYERRIVHLTLEKDERVFTESDGNGVYKRVRVIPANQRGRSAEGLEEGGRRGRGGRGGQRGPGRRGGETAGGNRAPRGDDEFGEFPGDDSIGNRVTEERPLDDDIGNRR